MTETLQETTRNAPYDEGYQAYDDGYEADENPYDHESDEEMEWAHGTPTCKTRNAEDHVRWL